MAWKHLLATVCVCVLIAPAASATHGANYLTPNVDQANEGAQEAGDAVATDYRQLIACTKSEPLLEKPGCSGGAIDLNQLSHGGETIRDSLVPDAALSVSVGVTNHGCAGSVEDPFKQVDCYAEAGGSHYSAGPGHGHLTMTGESGQSVGGDSCDIGYGGGSCSTYTDGDFGSDNGFIGAEAQTYIVAPGPGIYDSAVDCNTWN